MEYDEYVVDLNADCKCGCMDLHRFHKIYHFPNDYGASVIGGRPHTDDESYRVMLIKFNSPEEYDVLTPPGFDKDVIECPSWAAAVEILGRVKAI